MTQIISCTKQVTVVRDCEESETHERTSRETECGDDMGDVGERASTYRFVRVYIRWARSLRFREFVRECVDEEAKERRPVVLGEEES